MQWIFRTSRWTRILLWCLGTLGCPIYIETNVAHCSSKLFSFVALLTLGHWKQGAEERKPGLMGPESVSQSPKELSGSETGHQHGQLQAHEVHSRMQKYVFLK